MKIKYYLFLIIANFFSVLTSCEDYNEKIMAGPFYGSEFNGELSAKPVSSLKLNNNFVLEIYSSEGVANPIAALRNNQGNFLWRKIMLPQIDNDIEPRGQILSINLKEYRFSGDTIKIYFFCDWIGGGKEKGIITLLSDDYSFIEFKLGW